MATAQVKRMHSATNKQVAVVDRFMRPQWSVVFDNNSRISRKVTRDTQQLFNCSGMRPYIERATPERWYWKKWEGGVGELFLMKHELQQFGGESGRILIEPNTKVPNGNKSWPFERWQMLVDRVGREKFVQCGKRESQRLVGVRFLITPDFRQAAALLKQSRGFIGTEGALHHAAAAIGIPSVVLWSEFISPEITGYESQVNIRRAITVCGSRVPCISCRQSMSAITVDDVEYATREVFR